ncbi:hypothetical protein A5698_08315 [Mycobacterium sp. E136]|uniref:hypothetical protein n=1 Tax=Mycobacterium sp. E136 TaxID=1834125 RepID=UPI0007FBC3F1|nr:hypothetical protein [Mycobacterium sp. E136]OBH00915.1 hypothetical protein A5698_08315 [Mycobacterium sp. E136]
MTETFSEEVQSIVGPLLVSLGFRLDAVDNNVDEGGRQGVAVFYRSDDCKLQIYWSAREREINAMIAPVEAPNIHGLYDRSSLWHYLTEFVERPNLPLEELVPLLKAERANFESDTKWLTWLRDRISQNFEAARAGVLALHSAADDQDPGRRPTGEDGSE